MSQQQGFFQRIKALSTPQKTLFAAALCQRMQPNYKYYAQEHHAEHIQVLNDALLLLWQRVYDKQLSLQYSNIQTKLEAILPELEQGTYSAANPAFDAVVAVITVFNVLESKVDDDLNNLSKLSSHTVRHFIAHMEENELAGEALQDFIFAHPLMKSEQDVQNMLLDWVEQRESTEKDQVKGLREELIEYQISNLNID